MAREAEVAAIELYSGFSRRFPTRLFETEGGQHEPGTLLAARVFPGVPGELVASRSPSVSLTLDDDGRAFGVFRLEIRSVAACNFLLDLADPEAGLKYVGVGEKVVSYARLDSVLGLGSER